MAFRLCFFLAFSTLFNQLQAQYILNGSAVKNNCNCYTLTSPAQFQNGSVWNANKINLTAPFDFSFNVFLGCSDAGADGMVFMLQPLSTSIGTSGEGMGFQGVKPSLGIALDTYQNLNQNDPAYDHISIQSQGIIHHAYDLAGPVAASASSNNIEDCKWHKLRITWNPQTQVITAVFDGVLRLEKQVDLIGSVFYGDPLVYWGFSGATGGEVNLQQFCTALNPDFTTSLAGNAGCAPATITFQDKSVSFAAISDFAWDFGNGQTSKEANPPPQLYNQPGDYTVRLSIKGQDGCMSDTLMVVKIGGIPDAAFAITDTCYGIQPRITSDTLSKDVSSYWYVNDSLIARDKPPDLGQLLPGSYRIRHKRVSQYGCGESEATKNLTIKPRPLVTANAQAACLTVAFTADQKDSLTVITAWNWRFGDGTASSEQHPLHQYQNHGTYHVQVTAVAANGCAASAVIIRLPVEKPEVHAGADTLVLNNRPFQLNGRGTGNLTWAPASLVSDASLAKPWVTLQSDQQFVLTAVSEANCSATDTVNIKVMKGPAIYVPTAFTPNSDGKNDRLKPVAVGVIIERFTVYNRWGQQVFSMQGQGDGWDGRWRGVPQSGTFVWMSVSKDLNGNKNVHKGTVTIIR